MTAISNHFIQQLLIVLVMFFLALYIQELPSSNTLQTILPEWPFLLTLYFSVSDRYLFGVISAFIVGLIEDVFLGVPAIGIHAAIYVLAAFFLIAMRLRFRHLNLSLQSMLVGLIVLIKIIILVLYNTIFFNVPNHFWSLLSIPLTMLMWPSVHLFFQFFANRHTT